MNQTNKIVNEFIITFNSKKPNFNNDGIGIKLAKYGINVYQKHQNNINIALEKSKCLDDMLSGLEISLISKEIKPTKVMLLLIGTALLSIDVTIKKQLIEDFNKLDGKINWESVLRHYQIQKLCCIL